MCVCAALLVQFWRSVFPPMNAKSSNADDFGSLGNIMWGLSENRVSKNPSVNHVILHLKINQWTIFSENRVSNNLKIGYIIIEQRPKGVIKYAGHVDRNTYEARNWLTPNSHTSMYDTTLK